LKSEQGRALGIPGLINETCYDSLKGSDVVTHPGELAGFGILANQDNPTENPKGVVKNLTPRLDRLTVLFLKGSSAEISLE
jgi:hypothetical protein